MTKLKLTLTAIALTVMVAACGAEPTWTRGQHAAFTIECGKTFDYGTCECFWDYARDHYDTYDEYIEDDSAKGVVGAVAACR